MEHNKISKTEGDIASDGIPADAKLIKLKDELQNYIKKYISEEFIKVKTDLITTINANIPFSKKSWFSCYSNNKNKKLN